MIDMAPDGFRSLFGLKFTHLPFFLVPSERGELIQKGMIDILQKFLRSTKVKLWELFIHEESKPHRVAGLSIASKEPVAPISTIKRTTCFYLQGARLTFCITLTARYQIWDDEV